MTGRDLLAQKCPDLVSAVVDNVARDHGRAPRWQFIEYTDVEIAIQSERQRARDRRGSHDKYVRLALFFVLLHQL